MDVTWIGHSTFILKEGNFSVLTDPWFGTNIITPRVREPGILPDELPACNVVLVSHNHGDHWDKTGQKLAIKWKSLIVGPPSAANKMEGKGVEIEVAVPGKNISIGDVTIEVVPACHPAPGAKDAVGYIIKSGGHVIYFAGDTLLNQEVTDAVKKASPDIMFVPVGTFKILWKKVVMDASDAAQMAIEIGPKVFVPMHYGFLKGTKANLEHLRCLKDEGIALKPLIPGEMETIF